MTSKPAVVRRLCDLVWLCRVCDRIDREYGQPLGVEALVRGAHMLAGHFSRGFRLAYGESLPVDVARRARDGACCVVAT